jgi:predicted small lipoprotein YifL
MKRATRAIAAAVALSAIAACHRPAPDATPEGAVRAWLDRMEASDGDARAIKDAYGLLGPAARANLKERADRASRLEGHRVEPWEMLAEGRFGLKFRPKTMVSHVDGDLATVAVTGNEPLSEHATVRCAREAAAWRVEPDLPAVPALPRRDPDPAPPRGNVR